MKKKKRNLLNLALHWSWLIIFVVFIFLRLPSLFEPLTYGDEGIYMALGQAKRAGLTFYRDIHDNKPPLLYLVATASPTFFVYRLFYFLFSLVGFFVFRRLAQVLYPKSKASQLISLAVFAVLASIPLFEGQIGNAENYIIYLSSAAFLLLVSHSSPLAFFGAGVLFSLSTLFKIPGGFDFVAAGIIFFLLPAKKIGEILSFWKKNRFWLFLAGFFAPLILTTLYYYQVGAGSAFVRAALAQNIPYLSSWGQEKTTGFQLPISMIGKVFIVALPTLGLFLTRHQKKPLVVKISVIWFVYALFAALLSSRPYPHYLLQAVPAIALGAGLLITTSPKLFRTLPIIFTLCLWLIFNKFNYYRYPVLTYYQNFFQYATGQIDSVEYLGFWGNWAFDLTKIGHYINTHSQSNQKIFVWSDQPAIYPISRRLPVGRFTAAYHIKTFDQDYTETLRALKKEVPILFLVDKTEQNSLGPLKPWLDQHYTRTHAIGEIIFYHYLTPGPNF